MSALINKNQIILGFEALLFSLLFGVAFKSWVIFVGIFLGMICILNKSKGTVVAIYIFSFLWGFIAFSIGHSLSWGWAMALGAIFFSLGVIAHLTGLKKPLINTTALINYNKFEWLRNGYQGQNNMN